MMIILFSSFVLYPKQSIFYHRFQEEMCQKGDNCYHPILLTFYASFKSLFENIIVDKFV